MQLTTQQLDSIAENVVGIWDNEGESIDRYTVIYDEPGDYQGNLLALGMSSRPFHPQGIGTHCAASPGDHLGKEIEFEDLPEDCQKAVLLDLENPEG